MDSPTREEIVSHADEQDCELHSQGLEDDQVGVEKQKDARKSGRQYRYRGDDHEPLVCFRAVAQQKTGGYQSCKKNQAENLKRQKTERRRTSRRSETALRRLHRHDPSEGEHRHNDCDAGIAELLVNADLLRGNQRGLRYQENQPTGKNDAVENKE